MIAQFTKWGIFNKNAYYHIGVQPSLYSLIGHKPDEAVEITFKIAESQVRDDADPLAPDYWGWYDFKKQEFTNLIYPKHFLLDMCFPAGIKGSEDADQGKAYRLEIVSTNP